MLVATCRARPGYTSSKSYLLRFDFHARAVIDAEIEAFVLFREALIELYRDLRGEALLETREHDLKLEATVNKLGHVFWNGTVGFGYSGGGDSAEYTFWIADDQTSLPIIVDGSSDAAPHKQCLALLGAEHRQPALQMLPPRLACRPDSSSRGRVGIQTHLEAERRAPFRAATMSKPANSGTHSAKASPDKALTSRASCGLARPAYS